MLEGVRRYQRRLREEGLKIAKEWRRWKKIKTNQIVAICESARMTSMVGKTRGFGNKISQ